jgi:organic radical activating enzyme
MEVKNRTLFADIKDKLDSVSSCFCLAKWNRTTLYLQNGTTHSCHLPEPHPIDLNSMRSDPFALLNTPHILKQRQGMMTGSRPQECGYCWSAEDAKNDVFSDRVLKASSYDYEREIPGIAANPLNNRHVPKNLEVSFSHKCQFKCSYCSAHSSSSWEQELKTFGLYESGAGGKPDPSLQSDDNEYLQTFWKLWPNIRGSLKQFRITGGEPLLSPMTFTLLEDFLINPQPHLALSINTNMCAPDNLMTKFISLCGQLVETKALASLTIYTSIEAVGEKAEYIRHGLNAAVFWNNLSLLANASPAINIKIMSTFNALCITSFIPLLEQVRHFNENDRYSALREIPLHVEITQLRTPVFQSVLVLEPEYHQKITDIISFMEKNSRYEGSRFGTSDVQLNMMRRILRWAQEGAETKERKKMQSDFFSFFSEHDRRRNTDLLRAFPEFGDQWEACRAAHMALR